MVPDRVRAASSRSSRCLGLPKPLWHEVFELWAALAELSRIELLKRTDLQNDEGEKPMN